MYTFFNEFLCEIHNNPKQWTKSDVIKYVNAHYVYHRSNTNVIKAFNIINHKVLVGSEKYATGHGVYFNFDKQLYKNLKGTFLYTVSLKITNPYITHDQIYSALITNEKMIELDENGFDSVVLIWNGELVEVVVFNNDQIRIHEVVETS